MRAMLKGHKYPVSSVVFSPNGRCLVSASDDRSVRIWTIRDGSSRVLPVTGSPRYFESVVFSPNGLYVAAGNRDKSLDLDMGFADAQACGEVVGTYSLRMVYGIYTRRYGAIEWEFRQDSQILGCGFAWKSSGSVDGNCRE